MRIHCAKSNNSTYAIFYCRYFHQRDRIITINMDLFKIIKNYKKILYMFYYRITVIGFYTFAYFEASCKQL
jgi:hypothetical protein